MPLRLGIDVGGSAIKLGVVDAEGARHAERELAVPSGAARASMALRLGEAARELHPGGPVGIGLPGLFNAEHTAIANSPNLPWLEGLELGEELGRALSIDPADVRLENDANAAALGEQWLGAARGEENTLVLTLGTGIGGGLILNGALYRGEGLAGEIGHVRIDPRGPLCGCGARGCIETLASATAARRRATEAGLPPDDPGNLEQLVARAESGSAPEGALLESIGLDLGRALSGVVSLLDLRSFVIGGGFSPAFEALLPGIRQGIREGAYGERVEAIRLARAELGGSAGWIGAARLALA